MALAEAGARVIMADIDQNTLEKVVGSVPGAVAEDFDVSDPDGWEASAQRIEARFGGLDVLVNNAGVGSAKKPLEEISRRDWDWIFSINVHGLRHGLATWLPRMKARGGEAHVVNTASILGQFALPTASDYVATKFAVVGMTEALRLELRNTAIGVSLLCPGLVATPLSQSRDARDRLERGEAPAETVAAQRGIDASRVGEDVVAAIRDNTFYIFTHAEYEAVVERRRDDLRADFARARPAGEDIRMLAGAFLDLPRG